MIRDRENKDIAHEMNIIRKGCPPDVIKHYDDHNSFTKLPRVAKIYSADRYHSAIGKTLDMRV